MFKLFKGQNLMTSKGELVEIVKITSDTIRVKYNNRYYDRDISIVGVRLFVTQNDKNINLELETFLENQRLKKIELNSKATYKEMYAENCKIWPKKMQGGYGRYY